ncbi:DUF4145 domain-containing protein [Pseudomonas tohonis]|nr:DUF4145 domain-containing protein [Pseudomonas tohonis]
MGKFVYAATCPHCGVQKSSFTGGTILRTDDSMMSRIPLSCSHCYEVIVVVASHIHGFVHAFNAGKDEVALDRSNSVFPIRFYPAGTQHSAPEAVPERIGRYFVEAKDNLSRGNYETCILLCGKTLDLATRDMDQSWRLDKRIKKLADDGKITAEMAAWAEEIRIDRNDAVHDDVDFEQSDAIEIIGFIEAFLNYLYTLPALVHARRQERQGQESSAPAP